jgi:S1-C subfamily serine protease
MRKDPQFNVANSDTLTNARASKRVIIGNLKNNVLNLLLMGVCALATAAQTALPTPNGPEKSAANPQVVTVAQRLSGLQALSLLRENGDGEIRRIDRAELLNPCYTVANITAGYALGDGANVVALLAQTPAALPPECPKANVLSVYDGAGRELAARFIGLDARTGLSLLQAEGLQTPAPPALTETPAPEKELLILAPQPATPEVAQANKIVIRPWAARLQSVAQTSSGYAAQFLLSGNGLTPTRIGGVVVNSSAPAQTVGLVINAQENEARVLPWPAVLQAAARLRVIRANAPRPFLGAQLQNAFTPGAGVLALKVETATPAARAGLRAGDTLLQLNGQALPNLNDFAYLLNQREAGETVTFTVRRPNGEEVSLPVQLGRVDSFPAPPAPFSDILTGYGLHTMGLAPALARTLGARGGRVVLSVQADSRAALAGLQAGDIIESLNGQILNDEAAFAAFSAPNGVKAGVRRQKRRFSVNLARAKN